MLSMSCTALPREMPCSENSTEPNSSGYKSNTFFITLQLYFPHFIWELLLLCLQNSISRLESWFASVSQESLNFDGGDSRAFGVGHKGGQERVELSCLYNFSHKCSIILLTHNYGIPTRCHALDKS